jgi:tetratricopeptide (TPR) repeat protein
LLPLLLELCRKIGDVEREAAAHFLWADVDAWAFDIASARQHLRAAASLAERIGKLQSLASTAVNAGWLEYRVGLLDDAERFYAQALAYADRLDSAKHRSIIHGNLAHVALVRGDPERALTEAQRASQLANEVNDRQLAAWNFGLIGSALYQLGRDLDRSLASFTEALELCETFGFDDDRLEMISEMIPTLIACGKLERAATFAAELEEAISAHSSAVVMPVLTLINAARACEARGEGTTSRALRERARSLLLELLEKLPDERTRAAYAALPFHRPLLEAVTTTGSSPRP